MDDLDLIETLSLALFLSSCFYVRIVSYRALRFAAGRLFTLLLDPLQEAPVDPADERLITLLRERYRWERPVHRAEAEALSAASVYALEPPARIWQTRLFAASSAPPFFYVKSSQPPDGLFAGPAAAVVGSRRPNPYGLLVTKRLVKAMSEKGILTISGGAMGIDREAHVTALAEGGLTAAVLGHGVDLVYPAQNRALFSEIAGRGWLISEYRPGTPPRPYRFPARNRLIAGLADTVIVTSAKQNSGTLITAGFAADQGKPVFAVPGSILEDEADSCHRLIKEGAFPYTDISDLACVWPDIF